MAAAPVDVVEVDVDAELDTVLDDEAAAAEACEVVLAATLDVVRLPGATGITVRPSLGTPVIVEMLTLEGGGCPVIVCTPEPPELVPDEAVDTL